MSGESPAPKLKLSLPIVTRLSPCMTSATKCFDTAYCSMVGVEGDGIFILHRSSIYAVRGGLWVLFARERGQVDSAPIQNSEASEARPPPASWPEPFLSSNCHLLKDRCLVNVLLIIAATRIKAEEPTANKCPQCGYAGCGIQPTSRYWRAPSGASKGDGDAVGSVNAGRASSAGSSLSRVHQFEGHGNDSLKARLMEMKNSCFGPGAFAALTMLLLSACSPPASTHRPGEGRAKERSTGTEAGQSTRLVEPPLEAGRADGVSVMTLAGLDDLQIGRAVPEGGSWMERGAQQSEICRTVSSPDYPGVYAIVEGGTVRRISIGSRSEVAIDNIGVGEDEDEVRRQFSRVREASHQYLDAPAKYLTVPGASVSRSGVRFEIDADGRVSVIHVGLMPVLAYVEGCG